MSRKQQIYAELLKQGLLAIRFYANNPLKQNPELCLRACAELSQLLHNVPGYVLEPQFTEFDLYFLNVEAETFWRRSNGEEAFLPLFKELAGLVPESMRSKLEWQPP